MARSDLLVTLVHAATSGNNALVRKTVEAIAAEERAKKHVQLAEHLERQLQPNGMSAKAEVIPLRPATGPDVLSEITPRRAFTDLVLDPGLKESFAELVQEHHRVDLLRSYNLRPRNRILLIGPPGNGKTSVAEAIAHALMVPLVVARYDSLITSFLGETATRLKRLFDYAHTRRCVLFFDEFDTLGKERGDIHETGEIKRVVSSLLLQIDDLPSHVVVICATNHPELLDRAVWRRFQLRLKMGPPSNTQVGEYVSLLAERMGLNIGSARQILVRSLKASSFSEIEDFMSDLARTYVLSLPGGEIGSIIRSKIRQWKSRPPTGSALRSSNSR